MCDVTPLGAASWHAVCLTPPAWPYALRCLAHACPWLAVADALTAGMAGAILAKLTNIVHVNSLQRFYPPQSLQGLAQRVDSRINFKDLAAR